MCSHGSCRLSSAVAVRTPQCYVRHKLPRRQCVLSIRQVIVTFHGQSVMETLFVLPVVLALRYPPKPTAINDRREVVVTIEQFWMDPYWKDLRLENLTLFYEFPVTVREILPASYRASSATKGATAYSRRARSRKQDGRSRFWAQKKCSCLLEGQNDVLVTPLPN